MVRNNIFLENIKNNKKFILYYCGVFLGALLRVFSISISDNVPTGAWWSEPVIQIMDLLLIFFGFIAPFIFGGRETIDALEIVNARIKVERQDQGIENSRLEAENNAYRVVNKMQSQLLAENEIISLEYNTDGTYGKKTEKKIEPLD